MKLFSGKNSEKLWDEINNINSVNTGKEALYSVCCKIQELENKLDEMNLYKKALTKACSLPKGQLPNDKDYYSVMLNGNVIVKIKDKNEY